jgi:uncharacterized protein
MPQATCPLFIDTPGGAAFALLHEPTQGTPHTLVLHAHAFAEEMNKSRRMVALQARQLAEQGAAVLLLDLPGCGDSAGELARTGWPQWLDALAAAAHWLRQRHGAALPLWLWGHRAGALLAAQAAAGLSRAEAPCHLLLWQPVPAGRVALQQFLRLKMAAGLQTGGDARNATEQLRAALARGEAVEVAGYQLPAAVADGLAGATLKPPAGVAAGRLVWLEVASAAEGEAPALLPAASAPLAAFEAQGWQVQAAAVAGPMFWQTTEIEDAPALVAATTAALGLAGTTAPGALQVMPNSTAAAVAPGCIEDTFTFACGDDTLVGLLSRPDGAALRRTVLWGLCDGASASLLYLDRRPDPRVHGLVLLNPWVRSEASLARTQVKHYYRDRLRQREFWLKLLRGGVAWQALRGLVANVRRATGRGGTQAAGELPYQARMARAWRRFAGPSLLVLSGRDYTAREFIEYTAGAPEWQGLRQRPGVQTLEPAEADHTFSSLSEQRALEAATLRWLGQLPPA